MAPYLFCLMAVFCQRSFAQPEFFALDEISMDFLNGTAQSGSRVAMLYVKGLAPSKVGVFDFERGAIELIQDGRLQAFGAFKTVAFGEGFLVVDSLLPPPSFNYLTWSGEYQWKRGFSETEAWQSDYKFTTHLMPILNGHVLATLNQNGVHLILAEIDFESNRLTPLAQRRLEEDISQFWATDGKDYYWINSYTGLVELLSPKTFQRVSLLRPGQELVKKEKVRPKRAKYQMILGDPRLVEETLFLQWNQYRDKFGNLLDKPRFKALAIKGERLWQVDHYPVAYWKGKYLVYDRVERTLALREHLTDP